MTWLPIETAPKGEKKPYGSGPRILGVIVHSSGSYHEIVRWNYHKNPEKGSWKGPHGNWEPDFWTPLPTPPGEEA